MDYSIDNFWKNRISTEDSVGVYEDLTGWSEIDSPLPTFIEAPMTLIENYGKANPQLSSIILVSAPGAVGKTTLAKQISAVTGAKFINLARAPNVAENTLSGGLLKAKLIESFENGKTAVIIDGLDEARMTVPQDSMGAFIKDVVYWAKENRNPIVMLGRTGAIQEVWLLLHDHDVEVPVLEIGYYGRDLALEFVKTQIQDIRKDKNQREPDERAASSLLEKLRNATRRDGATFAGYAPVLMALAEIIASGNTQQLISRIEKGEEVFNLKQITDEIMRREQAKLSKIQFNDPEISKDLYLPEEQLDRLITRIYGGILDVKLPKMSSADREMYDKVVARWFVQHPFLDGRGRSPSSIVFDGLLAAHALNRYHTEKAALKKELSLGMLANPFLAEFYIHPIKEDKKLSHIPSEHIGVLYSSIRASLSIDEYASLKIIADNESQKAEIEKVNKAIRGDNREPLRFEIDASGDILFGNQIEDVDIEAPEATISIGGFGKETILIAPIYIEAKSFIIESEKMIVKESPQVDKHMNNEMNEIQLSAHEPIVSDLSECPSQLGEVSLKVAWPGAESFPWRTYHTPISNPKTLDKETEEGIRRLRSILRLFRSHGKGQLAKYKDAINHIRRTRGLGELMLKQLIEEKILTLSENMYFLDTKRLDDITGLKFKNVRSAEITQKTIDFVQKVLKI